MINTIFQAQGYNPGLTLSDTLFWSVLIYFIASKINDLRTEEQMIYKKTQRSNLFRSILIVSPVIFVIRLVLDNYRIFNPTFIFFALALTVVFIFYMLFLKRTI